MDLVETISQYLDSGKYKEALTLPEEKKYETAFKDGSWDLIPVITNKIQDDTIVVKPSLQSACEQLLSVIAKKANPEEALLEFIEQIEGAKNDAQFMIILGPLQQLLKKLTIKRGRSLEWCLNSITSYINAVSIPVHKLEGNERILMDSDPNVRRIVKIYSQLPLFYQPFIKEALAQEESDNNLKEIFSSFTITLLGKPLIYLDLDPEVSDHSEARLCALELIQDICALEKDILKLLIYLKKKDRNHDEDEVQQYQRKEKIDATSYSGLYYVVLSGHFAIPDPAIPQVYNAEYIVHSAMLAVIHMLSYVEYGPISKAISLCEALLNRLSYPVSHTLLSSSVHFQLCKGLVNVAVFSNFETLRKSAVSLIGKHVNKFEYRARCMLIKCLLDVANHSGMIGYIITLYKNSINEAFSSIDSFPECFSGAQLFGMIKKMCYLPHGAESDLVELADQIITTLNLIRFLTLRDSKNISGIRDCFTYIEDNYIDNLRTGLNMSKAHYEVKLKDIEEGKKLPEEQVDVSINVGGDVFDTIPLDSKKQMINSALNAFHLMEGLIARVSECINNNKANVSDIDCATPLTV